MQHYSVRIIATMFAVYTVASCKQRSTSELASSDSPFLAEIEGFQYEPDQLVLKELAARVGCTEAKRWVLTPNGRMQDIIPKIKEQKSPYDYLMGTVFAKSQASCGESGKKTSTDGIKSLHKLVTSKGYSLSVLMIGGFGSHLTKDGALSLSRAVWSQQMPSDSFRVERVECTPNSYGSDDLCAPVVKGKIESLIQTETGKPHLYLLWGYSKGGTVASQVLAISPKIRDKVIGVVTVGSPFGGGLPMKTVVPIFDKIVSRIDSLPLTDRLMFNGLLLSGSGMAGRYSELSAVSGMADLFTPAQIQVTKAGLTSVLPSERSKVLANTVSKWDFTRSTPSPITGGTDIPFFHISAAVDVAQFRVTPEVSISENQKLTVQPGTLNVMQVAELAMLEELSRHPLSDMCVALEHSVIPPRVLPKGMKPQLLTLLQMDHMSLGFSEKASPTAPPGEAIVDAVVDAVRQKLEGGGQ